MRERMSLPTGSVPRMCPGENAGRPELRMLPPTGGGTGNSTGPRKHAPTIRTRMVAGIAISSVTAHPRLGRAGAPSTAGAPGPRSVGRTSGIGAAIPDPRVQDRIEQVGEQVREHHDESEDE